MTSMFAKPTGAALSARQAFPQRLARLTALSRRAFAALATLLAAELTSAVSFGDEVPLPEAPSGADASMWRQSWPTFSWLEGVLTVAAGTGTLALVLAGPAAEARWRGGILFDDAVRDGLRLESAGARRKAARLGDLPYYTAAVIPLLVDPIAIAWLGNHDPKAAANLALTGLQAFSYAGLLSFVSTRTFARQRPDSEECQKQHPDGTGCAVDTEAFWSGHTTIVATSAGLVCANHVYLPLWKYPSLDVAACVLSSAGAVATGVSRVLADRHYASDVLVGGAVGFGIGYAVPVLLHYTAKSAPVTLSFRNESPCEEGCVTVGGNF